MLNYPVTRKLVRKRGFINGICGVAVVTLTVGSHYNYQQVVTACVHDDMFVTDMVYGHESCIGIIFSFLLNLTNVDQNVLHKCFSLF